MAGSRGNMDILQRSAFLWVDIAREGGRVEWIG